MAEFAKESLGFGSVKWAGREHFLRSEFYYNDEGELVFPLDDGTDLVCRGLYLSSLSYQFPGQPPPLPCESVCLVGNNKVWSGPSNE